MGPVSEQRGPVARAAESSGKAAKKMAPPPFQFRGSALLFPGLATLIRRNGETGRSVGSWGDAPNGVLKRSLGPVKKVPRARLPHVITPA